MESPGGHSTSAESNADEEHSKKMTLFVYTVAHDIGFAPNPFHGCCTLATCKAILRGAADLGDWVVGVGSVSKKQRGKLVYAMQVQEKLSFDEYWHSPRFHSKRPQRSGSIEQRYGDNVYHWSERDDKWIQEDCRHSCEDGTPNLDHVHRDTSHAEVLVSRKYAYYGANAIDIPTRFTNRPEGDMFVALRGYRRNFTAELESAFTAWLEDLISDVSVHGDPLDWAEYH